MSRVECGDFAVGDIHPRLDLFVDQLVFGKRAANVALEVIQTHLALLKLFVEFFLRVGRFEFSDLGVDVLVACGEVELGGALLQNLLCDHLVEDGEAADVGFLGRGLLGSASEADLVVAVHLRAHEVLAIDGGNDIGGGRTMASCCNGERCAGEENEEGNTRTQRDNRFNLQPSHS